MKVMEKYKVLIAVTGSVAAMKISELVNTILKRNATSSNIIFEVCVVITEHSKHFFKIPDIAPEVMVYDDQIEWKTWKQRGDPVIHIELGKWANLMLIAPCDANTLAKISQGLCDNLVTNIIRAWDASKPLLFCPAMNTHMWNHPITAKQICVLEEWGYIQIPPVVKTLMCGDTGMGGMAELETIARVIDRVAGYKPVQNVN